MKYLYDHIVETISDSKIHLIDPEQIDSVKDYNNFLNDLLSIIGVQIKDFQGFEGETRLIKFKINTSELSIFVNGNSDYVDHIPILKEINKKLSEGSFYSFWSGDFGQELGFFYTEDPEIIDQLTAHIKKDKNIGQIDGIEIRDEEKPVGIWQNEIKSKKENKDILKIVKKHIRNNAEKKYSRLDYIILIVSFLLILFGTFIEVIIPSLNFNLFTGAIRGLIIGFGMYKINKHI
ncbi:hypothetical protein Q4566_16925 [Tamlana sp. 2_MG-2023]|uniref:hypothetical protein n=1 Tax=unclassified Tamlana TaxID=2614803 RepID=UPI0026E24118|nr:MULTISPECIES: hypothetical protein [unclassified Tamlana]MDO6761893.1 hypothetical protein [Tamlana sp. 2_MG-2023]MDO6792216.1 hypothetical protein [Tamlana sp. 1_MG-2023]